MWQRERGSENELLARGGKPPYLLFSPGTGFVLRPAAPMLQTTSFSFFVSLPQQDLHPHISAEALHPALALHGRKLEPLSYRSKETPSPQAHVLTLLTHVSLQTTKFPLQARLSLEYELPAPCSAQSKGEPLPCLNWQNTRHNRGGKQVR